jgi:hypothetical protein
MYPNQKKHRSKPSSALNMPEWCMGSYHDAGESIVEDEEGIKLRLKQTPRDANTARFPGYWD